MPPTPTLFPYTTLFRSNIDESRADRVYRVGYVSNSLGVNGYGVLGMALALIDFGKSGQMDQQIGTSFANRAAGSLGIGDIARRSEEHTSELQSLTNLVCLLHLHSFPTRRSSDLI